MALVVVLWFIAAMSVLVAGIVAAGRESALVARNAVQAIEARSAMQSAVVLAAEALRRGAIPPTGVLEWELDGAWIAIRMMPEAAKIDVNTAAEELIAGLAAAVVVDPARAAALADALLDWRDADTNRRLSGSERDDYQRAGSADRPRDGAFETIEELRGVAGMDGELYAAMRKVVSVHNGHPEPPVVLPDSLVQRALDHARGLVDRPFGGETLIDSAFETPVEALDAATGDGRIFIADPDGVYALDIDLQRSDGARFRREAVIWIEPPFTMLGHFSILQNRAARLPAAAEVTWPLP